MLTGKVSDIYLSQTIKNTVRYIELEHLATKTTSWKSKYTPSEYYDFKAIKANYGKPEAENSRPKMNLLLQEPSDQAEENRDSATDGLDQFIKKTFDPIIDNRSLHASPLLKKPQSSSSSSKKSNESDEVNQKRLESPNLVTLRSVGNDDTMQEDFKTNSKKPPNARSALSFMLRTQSLNSKKNIKPVSGSMFSRLLGKHSESQTVSFVQTNPHSKPENNLLDFALFTGGITPNLDTKHCVKDVTSTLSMTRNEKVLSGFATTKADPNTTRIESLETQETRRIELLLNRELSEYGQDARPASAPILRTSTQKSHRGNLLIHTDRQQLQLSKKSMMTGSGLSVRQNTAVHIKNRKAPSKSVSEISNSQEKRPSALASFFLDANPVFLKERYAKPQQGLGARQQEKETKPPQKIVFAKTMREVPIDVDIEEQLPSRQEYIQKGEFSFMMHDYFGRQVQKSIYNPKRSKYHHGHRGTSLLFNAFDTNLKQSADQSMATNVSGQNDEPEYVKIREEAKRVQREDRIALKNYLSSSDPKSGLPQTSAPAYLQMADMQPKLDRVLKISRADSQSTLFVRKHIRNQSAAANPLPTDGELPRSRYSLLLVEGAVQKKQNMRSREEQRRKERETEYLEKLGGKYTAIPEVLTPAKKLQTLIYEHRYVC